MQYQEFVNTIIDEIKSQVAENVEVKVHHVVKNNGIHLDAVVIMQKNQNTAPNIYLNTYYEQYQNGKKMEDILNEILIFYVNAKIQPEIDLERLKQFKNIQSNIVYRLVNYKKNEKLLNDTPHIRFVDFAIIFYCLVNKDESGIESFRISHEMAEKWEVTSQQLMKLAQKNTPKLFPPRLTTMEELLTGLFQADMEHILENYGDVLEIKQAEESAKEMVRKLIKSMRERRTVEMFVLTNQMGINGASVVLYPEVLKEFSKLCGSNLYLLPSSIHEFIIVPKYEFIHKEDLTQMVQEVNASQVAVEEILSDHVYEYCTEEDSIIF